VRTTHLKYNTEINRRMSKRFAWLLGLVVLVAIGLLVACGDVYNSSYDGLVLVTSQGSGLLETFSFGLNTGSIAPVDNPPDDTGTYTCVLNGLPSAIVVDPAGAYAYAILTANQSICGSGSTSTGIIAFKVNSNGRLQQVGSLVPDPNPIGLVMDTTGKFLFVVEASLPAEGVPGMVNSYAIGSGGSLAAVGSYTPTLPPGLAFQTPDISAIAVTPMVLPGLVNGIQLGPCSSTRNNKPTSEYLYAADAQNNVVWEFVVNTSTGALSTPLNVGYFFTGPAQATPAGVAVDACDRFVYVTNALTNNVAAYSICNGLPSQSLTNCPKPPEAPDGSLVPVAGSPFSIPGSANGPGPILSDPFANTIYVLDTQSNQVSTFRINQASGGLTAGNPATVGTGLGPTSFAIRGDDSWLFVANFNSATISQYSITPSTGALSGLPVTSTDNQPWGVAVK